MKTSKSTRSLIESLKLLLLILHDLTLSYGVTTWNLNKTIGWGIEPHYFHLGAVFILLLYLVVQILITMKSVIWHLKSSVLMIAISISIFFVIKLLYELFNRPSFFIY